MGRDSEPVAPFTTRRKIKSPDKAQPFLSRVDHSKVWLAFRHGSMIIARVAPDSRRLLSLFRLCRRRIRILLQDDYEISLDSAVWRGQAGRQVLRSDGEGSDQH